MTARTSFATVNNFPTRPADGGSIVVDASDEVLRRGGHAAQT